MYLRSCEAPIKSGQVQNLIDERNKLRVEGKYAEADMHIAPGNVNENVLFTIPVFNYGKDKIVIISGIGAREYFRKFSYKLEGPYMTKCLDV